MSRKKNHTAAYMVTALVLIAAVLAGLYGKGILQSGLGTVMTLQQTQFISNDNTIGGQAWLLTWVQNGNGQYVQGSASASQIKDGSTSAKYGISLTASNSQQSCAYKLNKASSSIRHIEAIDKGYSITGLVGATGSCNINDVCKGFDGSAIYKPSLSLNSRCFCIRNTNSGIVGDIEQTGLNFKEDFKATINGKDYVGSLSNNLANAVWLGNNNEIQISWNGNLVSGDVCPQSSGQNIRAVYAGSWKIVDKDAVSKSLNYDFANCVDAKIDSPSGCAAQNNALESLALQSKSFTFVGGSSPSVSGDVANGKITIDLTRPIQYPSFTARVKADILGVVVPVSKPQIMDTDSQCFKTGSNGNIIVNIKNVGDNDGNFKAYANCPTPFSQTGSTISFSIAKGQTSTVNIPITGTTSQSKTNADCTIRVSDANNPNNYDEATQSACVQSIIICNAGDVRCNGIVKESCDGSQWIPVPNDNSCSIPIPKFCETHPADPICKGVCAWYDFSCKSIREIAGIIVAVIVFIMSWLFFNELFKNMIKNYTANVFVSMALGASVGFLVGYLAYQIFWTAIIGAVIWIFFTSFFTIGKKTIGFK